MAMLPGVNACVLASWCKKLEARQCKSIVPECNYCVLFESELKQVQCARKGNVPEVHDPIKIKP